MSGAEGGRKGRNFLLYSFPQDKDEYRIVLRWAMWWVVGWLVG